MKVAAVLGLVISFTVALGCGGNVVMDTGGHDGSGGRGGSSPDGGGNPSGAGSCTEVDCVGNATDCSCETHCGGPVLRAECKKDGDTLICECHYDGHYMGTCGFIGGSACGLPGGCCVEYVD
jgi:hypothetical protein